MTNRNIILIVSGIVIATVAIGALVSSVQGQAEAEIGVVNLDAVFTQYMAPPLVTARDEMQQEFDSQSADFDDEAARELFAQYQARLDTLEQEYRANIQDAIDAVGKENGMDIIVDSAAVLYGAVDLTPEVIEALE